MTGLFQYINFPDEPAEFQSKDDELAELRADLQAAQERIAALENDIICAFCGTHYHADDVPPQHYLTCESSPLVQRLARIDADNRTLIGELETLGDRCAEQARQLAEARKAMTDSIGFDIARPGCECPICAWLAANPATHQDDERIDKQLDNSGWEADEVAEV